MFLSCTFVIMQTFYLCNYSPAHFMLVCDAFHFKLHLFIVNVVVYNVADIYGAERMIDGQICSRNKIFVLARTRSIVDC